MKDKFYSGLRVLKNDGPIKLFNILIEISFRYWYVKRHGLSFNKNKISINELNKKVGSERYQSFGVEYGASQFKWMISGVNSLPIKIKNSIILDIGSGEGIPLCYFAQRGFKKVMGIEFSNDLVETSRHNLKLIHDRYNDFQWNIIEGDAYDYQIPDEVNVIWMFNPFTGSLLEKVLMNIHNAGQKRKIYILFANPPKENLTKKYLSLIKKIRPVYPRLFLYTTETNY
tara:strand:- start:2017 stop:2700 length:684 start_codon:yes stop_codon:yes gene_type:complete